MSSASNKVLMQIPVVNSTEKGSVVALYPEDVHPFGAKFLADVPKALAGTQTGTTTTLSITLDGDTDTDPADSDSD
jgi:hypothetical protein